MSDTLGEEAYILVKRQAKIIDHLVQDENTMVNKNYVDQQDALKVNITDMNAAMALKADKSVTDGIISQLSKISDDSYSTPTDYQQAVITLPSTANDGPLRIKLKGVTTTSFIPSNQYQSWPAYGGYPDSPELSSKYPYQCVFSCNGFMTLVMCASKIYRDSVALYASSGNLKVYRFNTTTRKWDYVMDNPQTSFNSTSLQNNQDIYGDAACTLTSYSANTYNPGTWLTLNAGPCKIESETPALVSSDYQKWDGYPDSPFKTTDRPKQVIFDDGATNPTAYLVVISEDASVINNCKFYECDPSGSSPTSFTCDGKYSVYNIVNGAWSLFKSMCDARTAIGIKTCIRQSNCDVLNSQLNGTYFHKTTKDPSSVKYDLSCAFTPNHNYGANITTYQKWDGHPDSPVKTSDYPYQCMECDSSAPTTYRLFVSDGKMYMNGTNLCTKGSTIQFYYNSGSAWTLYGSATSWDRWSPTAITLIAANNNVYTDSTCSSVKYAKNTSDFLDSFDFTTGEDIKNNVSTMEGARIINSHQNGIIRILPNIQDTVKYGTGISIANTAYPIKNLLKVFKLVYDDNENEVKTLIDLTKCTVASNGLSFTITGAGSDDVYKYEYQYDSGLGAQIIATVSYPSSIGDKVNGVAQQVVGLGKNLDDLQSDVNVLLKSKADKAYTDTNLALKADKSVVDGMVNQLNDAYSAPTDYQQATITLPSTANNGPLKLQLKGVSKALFIPDNTYQSWSGGLGSSPVKTIDYPYQLIDAVNSGYDVVLYVSRTKLYMDSTTPTIMHGDGDVYKWNGANWVLQTSGVTSRTLESYRQSNCTLYTDSTLTASKYTASASNPGHYTTVNVGPCKVESETAAPVTPPNQKWINYPDSPQLTTDYPYQMCLTKQWWTDTCKTVILAKGKLYKAITNGYLCIYSTGASMIYYYKNGVWTWYANYNAGDIIVTLDNTDAMKATFEANNDIYTDNTCATVFFKKTTIDPVVPYDLSCAFTPNHDYGANIPANQKWNDGAKDSPLLTSDYPYQAIVRCVNGGTSYYYLLMSKSKLYVNNNNIVPSVQDNSTELWNSSITKWIDWARNGYGNGMSSGLLAEIMQANSDVYADSTCSTVYFKKNVFDIPDSFDFFTGIDVKNGVTSKTGARVLNAHQNGAIRILPNIQDTVKYGTGISIVNTAYPIKSLLKVFKLTYDSNENEIKTAVDLTKCTVASDGLSFTITGGASDDIYKYEYQYSSTLLGAFIVTISYPTSIGDKVNGVAQQVVGLGQSLDDLQSDVNVQLAAKADKTATDVHFNSIDAQLADNSYSPPQDYQQPIIPLPSACQNGELLLTVQGKIGQNLVQNGDFSQGAAGWSVGSGNWDFSGGHATLTATAVNQYCMQYVPAKGSNRYFLPAFTQPQVNQQIVICYLNGDTYINEYDATYGSGTIITTPSNCTKLQVLLRNAGVTSGTFVFDNIMLIDLAAEGDTETDLTKLAAKYPFYPGMKSVGPGKLLRVGINLFDEKTSNSVKSRINCIWNGTKLIFNNQSDITNRVESRKTIYLENGKTYSFNKYNENIISGSPLNCYICPVGSTAGVIGITFGTPFTFNLSSGLYDVVAYTDVSSTAPQNITVNLMFTSNTTATAYVPYDQSSTFTPPVELLSVGAGASRIFDTYNVNTGELIHNCNQKVLQASDITSIQTSWSTNADFAIITKPSDIISTPSIMTGLVAIEGCSDKSNVPFANILSLVPYDFVYSTNYSSTGICVAVAKGATLAQAQTAFTGKKLIYAFAPQYATKQNFPAQVLNGRANGQVQWLNNIPDTAKYAATGIAIANTAWPIQSLVAVMKVTYDAEENEILTPVDLTKCTVASDGLSFTITGAVTGETYKYEFGYPPYLSNQPPMTVSYPISIKDQINGVTIQVSRLDEKVDDFTHATIAYCISNEARILVLENKKLANKTALQATDTLATVITWLNNLNSDMIAKGFMNLPS